MCVGGFSSRARGPRMLPTARLRHGRRRGSEVTVRERPRVLIASAICPRAQPRSLTPRACGSRSDTGALRPPPPGQRCSFPHTTSSIARADCARSLRLTRRHAYCAVSEWIYAAHHGRRGDLRAREHERADARISACQSSFVRAKSTAAAEPTCTRLAAQAPVCHLTCW